MKAEVKPRIDFEGRTKLETVIPLSTPYLVFLDPSDACNAKCSWCPTGSGEALKWKKPRMMDFDLYRKIIDDLASMPEPIKTLRLYKDGEPLLNPWFTNMVAYAKATERFHEIDTTTNGLLLDAKMAQNLSVSGLDKIFISVPQNYTPEYVSNIAYLRLNSNITIYVKMIGDGLTNSAKETFFNYFMEFADRIFIEHLAPCWPDYAVKGVGDIGIYGQPLQEPPKVCPYIFYSTAINSDGTVSLCFLDWRHEMLLGDLKGESFSGIWNGAMLKMIQILHLRKYRSKISSNCANCKQLIYGAPDNIDEYAGELQRKMEACG